MQGSAADTEPDPRGTRMLWHHVTLRSGSGAPARANAARWVEQSLAGPYDGVAPRAAELVEAVLADMDAAGGGLGVGITVIGEFDVVQVMIAASGVGKRPWSPSDALRARLDAQAREWGCDADYREIWFELRGAPDGGRPR